MGNRVWVILDSVNQSFLLELCQLRLIQNERGEGKVTVFYKRVHRKANNKGLASC